MLFFVALVTALLVVCHPRSISLSLSFCSFGFLTTVDADCHGNDDCDEHDQTCTNQNQKQILLHPGLFSLDDNDWVLSVAIFPTIVVSIRINWIWLLACLLLLFDDFLNYQLRSNLSAEPFLTQVVGWIGLPESAYKRVILVEAICPNDSCRISSCWIKHHTRDSLLK